MRIDIFREPQKVNKLEINRTYGSLDKTSSWKKNKTKSSSIL